MNEHDLMQALERRAEAVDPGGAPLAAMTGRADTLRKRRTAFTVVAAAAAVAVVATTLSVVGLGDDRSSAPEVIAPDGGGTSTLDGALRVLPGDALSVSFNDRSAAAERLGLTASTSSEYAAGFADAIGEGLLDGSEELGGLFGPSTEFTEITADLPFNEFSVLWTARASFEPSRAIGLAGVTVYQMEPETDLDAIADDLAEAGLVEEDLSGRRHLVADSPGSVLVGGVVGKGYPRDFLDVTVDTDADLVIVGSNSDTVLEVLDGERESLADSGIFDDLLAATDRVETADLEADPCLAEADDGVTSDTEPTAVGAVVYGSDLRVSARMSFVDDAAAAADLEARLPYLQDGKFGDDGKPLETFGSFEATRSGPVIDIEFSGMNSEVLRELVSQPRSIISC